MLSSQVSSRVIVRNLMQGVLTEPVFSEAVRNFVFQVLNNEKKYDPSQYLHGPRHTPLEGSDPDSHYATISSSNITAKGRSAEDQARVANEKKKYHRIDTDTMKKDPEFFNHNMSAFKDASYGMRPHEVAGNSEEVLKNVKNRMVSNLTFLANHVKSGGLTGDKGDYDRWRGWYKGANKIAKGLAKKHGTDVASTSGVIAALSPQNDWNMNVHQAHAVMDIVKNKQHEKWSDEMTKHADNIWGNAKNERIKGFAQDIKGKTLHQIQQEGGPDMHFKMGMVVRLHHEAQHSQDVAEGKENPAKHYRIVNPDGSMGDYAKNADGTRKTATWKGISGVANAIASMHSKGDANKLSEAMGSKHKVRSFYNNILDPHSKNGDVTVDTHAVGAAWMAPHGSSGVAAVHAMQLPKVPAGAVKTTRSARTGASGVYGVYGDAYREAAHHLGIKPHELQSVVWEAKRRMFGGGGQTMKNEVGKVWDKFSRGEISHHEAQHQVVSTAKNVLAQRRNEPEDEEEIEEYFDYEGNFSGNYTNIRRMVEIVKGRS